MNRHKPTLGIYGIKDISDSAFPGYVHDHAIAIMQNGDITDYVHLERITRKKYDNKLHNNIYEILKLKKLFNTDMDFVFVDNVIGRSFISTEGNIRFEAPINYKLNNSIEEGRIYLLDKHRKAYALNHELAHIYSAIPFFGDFKENSLLIHFDGGASLSNFSVWQFKNNALKLLDYHWKLKRISSFFNANALTFGIIGARIKEQNSVPGKIMGLAAFGSYQEDIEVWLEKNNFFETIWKSKKEFIEKAKSDFGYPENQLVQNNSFIQDVIATLHYIFERATLKEIANLKDKTKSEYLYFTGGSALNIKLNTRIIDELGFKDVFIPPCTNDSGLALGAAVFMEKQKGNTIKKQTPYLNNWQLNSQFDYTEKTIKNVAELILSNKVIGVSNGYGEIGPRALGNRSIIALANSKKLAQKVSMDIKKREWYRPVAPIMLEKNARYFTGKKTMHHLSKYMLLDFDILENKKKEIEGVVHADGTSRIQVLFTKTNNPFMWDLLSYLDENYTVKALINTSFNSQGEPIVQSEKDALESAKRMKLDALVLNGELQILHKIS